MRVLLIALLAAISYAQTDCEFVVNGNANEGFTGWNIIENGGNGVATTGRGHTDSTGWITSYARGTIEQTVDMYSRSSFANSASSAPIINFSVWYRKIHNNDIFWANVYLKDSSSTVITQQRTGDISVTSNSWTEQSFTFSNYGPNVRYVTIQVGGDDGEHWSGHYGTAFDDVSICIEIPTSSASSFSCF